jgi:hypothetical protein
VIFAPFAVTHPLFLLLPLLLFFSCATVPRSPDPFLDESGVLPLEPGASAYLLVEVSESRPILDRLEILGTFAGDAGKILDRTRTAAAAFYPEGHERRFQAAAWGKYPGFWWGLALSMSRDWKRRRSKTGGAYHYSPREGLSVALTASRAFAAGAGPGPQTDPFAPPPGTAVPEGFAEFRRGAVLALWLKDPAAPASRFFAALGIPLQLPAERILLSVFPASQEGERAAAEGGAQYEALIQIQSPAASQARALLSLINLARTMIPEMGAEGTASPEAAGGVAVLAGVLFANPPALDGRNLNLRTRPLDAAQIALLFNTFRVYSNEETGLFPNPAGFSNKLKQ